MPRARWTSSSRRSNANSGAKTPVAVSPEDEAPSEAPLQQIGIRLGCFADLQPRQPSAGTLSRGSERREARAKPESGQRLTPRIEALEEPSQRHQGDRDLDPDWNTGAEPGRHQRPTAEPPPQKPTHGPAHEDRGDHAEKEDEQDADQPEEPSTGRLESAAPFVSGREPGGQR